MESIANKLNTRLSLYLIFFLCAILLIFDPLIMDEVLPFIDSYIHAEKVGRGLDSGFSLTEPYYFGPVFHIIVAAISLITGFSVLDSLRFFTFIMRISMVLVVYLLSKNFLNSKVAILSVITASCVVEFIWPIPQALATIFLAMVVYNVYSFEKSQKFRYLILGYVFVLLICFLHLIVTIACFSVFFLYSGIKIVSKKNFSYIMPILLICSSYLIVWEATEGQDWKENINPRSEPPEYIALIGSILCYLFLFLLYIIRDKFLPFLRGFINYTEHYNPHKTSLKYFTLTYIVGMLAISFGLYYVPAYPEINLFAYFLMTLTVVILVIFSGSGISFMLREKNYFLAVWIITVNFMLFFSILGAGKFGLLLVRSLYVALIPVTIAATYYFSKLDYRPVLVLLVVLIVFSFTNIPHINFEGVENQRFDPNEEKAAQFLSNLSENQKIATDYRLHSLFRYYHENVTIKPSIYFDMNVSELESIDYIVFSKSYVDYGVVKDVSGPVKRIESNLTDNWDSEYMFTLYYSNDYVEIWKVH